MLSSQILSELVSTLRQRYKIFLIGATIWERKSSIWKSWMNVEHGPRTKMSFCKSFLMNSIGDSKRTKWLPCDSDPLPKDVFSLDNKGLTRKTIEEEILQVAKQGSPLKAPRPDSMHAIFYQKHCNIIVKNIYHMIINSHLRKESNNTHYSNPKIDIPKKVNDCRPLVYATFCTNSYQS